MQFERLSFSPPEPKTKKADRVQMQATFCQEIGKLAVNEGIAMPVGTQMLVSYAESFFYPRKFRQRMHEGKLYVVRVA